MSKQKLKPAQQNKLNEGEELLNGLSIMRKLAFAYCLDYPVTPEIRIITQVEPQIRKLIEDSDKHGWCAECGDNRACLCLECAENDKGEQVIAPKGYQIISEEAIRYLFKDHPEVYEHFYDLVDAKPGGDKGSKINRLSNLDMFDCESAQDEQSRIEIDLVEISDE